MLTFIQKSEELNNAAGKPSAIHNNLTYNKLAEAAINLRFFIFLAYSVYVRDSIKRPNALITLNLMLVYFMDMTPMTSKFYHL